MSDKPTPRQSEFEDWLDRNFSDGWNGGQGRNDHTTADMKKCWEASRLTARREGYVKVPRELLTRLSDWSTKWPRERDARVTELDSIIDELIALAAAEEGK